MKIKDLADTINGLREAARTLNNIGGTKLAENCINAVSIIEGKKPIRKERVESLYGDKYFPSYRCPEGAKPIDEDDSYCRYCGQAVLPVQMI